MPWFDYICTREELWEVLQRPEIQNLIIGYNVYENSNQVKIGYDDLKTDLSRNASITVFFGQDPMAIDPLTRIENGRYAGVSHLRLPNFHTNPVGPGSLGYDDKLIEFDVPPARPAFMLVRKAIKKICPYQTTGDKRTGAPFPRVSGTIRDLILERGYVSADFGNRFYFQKPAE